MKEVGDNREKLRLSLLFYWIYSCKYDRIYFNT